MGSLNGKKIIVGITGSIAAYKAAILVRGLIKAGAEVRVLMTPAATHFITPLTLSTLSKNPVYTDVIDESSWNNHVELGLWADLMVIAPATANSLGKLANGICDNIIAAVYLSARCPVFFAPAMDADMWLHPSVTHNIQKLESYGNHLLPVGYGALASGLEGKGRMAEPEVIVQHLTTFLGTAQPLKEVKFLITAGPTFEPMDPVRFIGNRSSGKMGVAIASELIKLGGKVTLIMGPSNQTISPEIETIRVETAQSMYDKTMELFKETQVAIFAAAVSDYRPKNPSNQKIKKKTDTLTIELVKNPDIAASAGNIKTANQITVGFALETNDERQNAWGKLQKKNFDLVVLNSLNDKGAGFQVDTNKVTFLYRDGTERAFDLKSKTEVAKDITQAISALIDQNR